MTNRRDDPMGIFEGYGEYDDKQAPMSDPHEDDLVTKVARAIYAADHEDLLGTEGYPEEVAERFARAALEASGITDLIRQLEGREIGASERRKWAEIIASQYETDAVDAIEEGVARGAILATERRADK